MLQDKRPRPDMFTMAYIEALLWSEHAYSKDGEQDPSYDSLGYTVEDIRTESLIKIIEDCRDFREAHDNAGQKLLDQITEHFDGNEDQYGHDFLLTRNRHGAGFWDRGWGELGKKLTDMANAYGSVTLMLDEENEALTYESA